MSAQHDNTGTAEIVDMNDFLESPGRKRVTTTAEYRENATLLSMRQSLTHKAMLRIDDLETVAVNLTKDDLRQLNATVRCLLNTEFGRLRVHRHRGGFAVGHTCLESLIAGLLRVQFHVRKISMPCAACDDTTATENVALSVSWGVGDSLVEAEHQRLRHKRMTKT